MLRPTYEDNESTESMIPLSLRKQQVLRALVEEYIYTATPVASETLVRKYRLPFSSATVRNELAGLEEAHLIYQPHTSAGRVPTDLGYRYFVEYLMEESALSLDEQRRDTPGEEAVRRIAEEHFVRVHRDPASSQPPG